MEPVVKKNIYAFLIFALSLASSALPIWEGSQDSIEVQMGKELKQVSVRAEGSKVVLDGITEGERVCYISAKVKVTPFSPEGKALAFTVQSSAPVATQCYYLRALDEKDNWLWSYKLWGSPLHEFPERKLLIPGLNDVMDWEKALVKNIPDAKVHSLILYIGAKGAGKHINMSIGDFDVVDVPQEKLEELANANFKESDLLTDGTWISRLRPQHPRLFLNEETLPAIRENVNGRFAERFQKLKEEVDNLPEDAPFIIKEGLHTVRPDGTFQLKKPALQGCSMVVYDGGRQAASIAFVYLMTGDEKYIPKAKAYMRLAPQVWEWAAKGNIWADIFGASRINALTAWDWLYDKMTPDERSALIIPMLEYITKTQPNGKYTFRRSIGGPTNGNYGETALEWYAGLAAYKCGIRDELAEQMLRRGAKLFVDMMDYRERVSGGSGLLAAITSGYTFGQYPYASLMFLYAWRAAFGEDLTDRWSQMADYPKWVDHALIPSKEPYVTYDYGIGDTPHRENRVQLGVGMSSHMAHIIELYGDRYPEKAQRAYALMRRIPEKWRWVAASPYPFWPYLAAKFDPEMIEKAPAPPEEPYYFVPSFGLLLMRSGLTPNDTYAAFRCGSTYGNHQHYDELSFVIYHKGFLAMDSGSRTEADHHHGYTSQSVAHNTILIHQPNEALPEFWKAWSYKPDGKVWYNHGGQFRNSCGRTIALRHSGNYVYAAADGTRDYSPIKCMEAVRQFVWIRPGLFVIYDRVESCTPEQEKEFLLHTQNKPEECEPGVLKMMRGDGQLFIRTLLPLNAKQSFVGGEGHEFEASGRNWELMPNETIGDVMKETGRWRLEVRSPAPAKRLTFLHVIEAEDSTTPKPVPAVLTQNGDLDTVTISCRDGITRAISFARIGDVQCRVIEKDASGKVLSDNTLLKGIE